jgi:YD repeat-containing protein
VDESFDSGSISLSYDDNGNLTDDGVFKYVYDAWNRLVEVTRRVDDETSVATYAYDGKNRRVKKAVSNSGVEESDHDGGNTTAHYYYSNKWQILETRDGSNQATAQYVWGTRYVDELVFADINDDPSASNVCDADDPNEADRRYFVHQDRNWNVLSRDSHQFLALAGFGGSALRAAQRELRPPRRTRRSGATRFLAGLGGPALRAGAIRSTWFGGTP